jgi:hypothetical protein
VFRNVFRRLTVDRWYPLDAAIREFGDPELVDDSAKAHQKWWQLFTEQATGAELNQADLEEATEQDNYLRERLLEDLRDRLTFGELIARGFREPISHGAPYLTISQHEWRVIELQRPEYVDGDRAAGGGIAYVGLTIGKPGTKRLFRRGSMNRHDQRRAVPHGVHCGWRGCSESFAGFVAPSGWVSLIVYCSPKPTLDIRQIKDWRHDKMFCPTHAKMLDSLLYPSAGKATAAASGSR